MNRDVGRGAELVRLLTERTPVRGDVDRGPRGTGCRRRPGPQRDLGRPRPDVDAELDLDPDTLPPEAVVADVVFNPTRTRLLRWAERGCRTLDGRGMLVNQAVVGVRLWTGVDVDPAVMRAELDRVLYGPRASAVRCRRRSVVP
ncbi:MAG: hypothetical protein R2734_09425 [Nocardioides sp.]